MRATLVASRPRTISVASITNQLAPTFRASASSPLATYVLIETVTPFPVETNINLRVRRGYCQRNVEVHRKFFKVLTALALGLCVRHAQDIPVGIIEPGYSQH